MTILPPGIPSDLEKYFYDRKEEMIKLKSFLNPLEDGVSSQILVTGYRGVGKSFLLMKLMQELPKNFLSVYIDVSKIYGIQKGKITEEKVMHTLIEEMGKSVERKVPERIYDYINTIIPKIRNKKYDFDNSGKILGISIPKVDDDYERLSHFVMEFPQKLIEKLDDKNGFVIIIDEFQLLGELSSPEAFFWMFRSYTQNQDNVSYIFTGSTSSSSDIIDKINGVNGAFGGRMIPFIIEPFTKSATKGYLEEKVSELSFTEDGFERFYKCTRGFPAYINSFCSVMSETKEYNEKMVADTFYNKIDQIAVMWISIWATLSEKEKDIVTILVEDGPQNWKNLEGKSHTSSKTLMKYLNFLKNKGIITHSDRLYKVDDHMLSAWLKYNKKMNGFYPP
jgi:AAA+ ATPase superfamily predicted ATPase